MEEVKKLNKYQLSYLTDELVGLIAKYADLYQSALDNPEKFCKRTEEYKKLFNLAKKSI